MIRVVARAARTLEAAARSSALAVFLARARHEGRALTAVHRVRLAGLLALTALVTEQLLIRLVPAQAQPMPPAALRDELALGVLIVIILAPPIARAWPTSRLRSALRQTLSCPPLGGPGRQSG